MKTWQLALSITLLAVTACNPATDNTPGNQAAQANTVNPAPTDSTPVAPTDPAVSGDLQCNTHPGDTREQAFKRFTGKVEAALGTFNDITVYKRASDADPWRLVSGQYIPVTVDDHAPGKFIKEMRSDQPMMLPTRVQGVDNSDGQSSPYSVVGRMPATNPEVEWVFVVRQYLIKERHAANFVDSGDIAVIGHHPRTGASAFFQYYNPEEQQSAEIVVSPLSEDGWKFWSDIVKLAENFRCERCHAADAFIHTPWADQARVRPDDPAADTTVPSSPLGPYFFVDSGPGGLFNCWNYALTHLKKADNTCTECHRVTPYDLAGLGQHATRYAGLSYAERSPFAIGIDAYQTDSYYNHTWMPPKDPHNKNFYAGQSIPNLIWEHDNGKSAAELNKLTLKGDAVINNPKLPPVTGPNLVDVPRPPPEYETILVDRPNQDSIAASKTLWIVDTRMRANTDGDLHQWQFVAKGQPNDKLQAAPVVYRREANDGSSLKFTPVFIGDPQGQDSAGKLVFVKGGETFRLTQGDYFGLMLTNTGPQSGSAIIPYTQDGWAKLEGADGTTRHEDGYVVYQATLDQVPAGDIEFGGADYRTYSFELRNKL